MKKIVCTRGLPASGKTTWAKKEVEEEGAKRFNKDDIRKELSSHDNLLDYSQKDFEKVVVEMERDRVKNACIIGEEYIIIDNTHLKYKDGQENKHIDYYRNLSKEYGYEFEIKEFYIDKEIAILRDEIRGLKGGASVGAAVINRFYKNMQVPSKYPSNPTFKELKGNTRCIILDIDGTLAFMDGKRSPYDYEKVINDRLNDRLMMLINILKHGDENYKTIIVTGRKEDSLPVTKEWLKYNHVEYDEIYARKDDDNRCDTIIKKEIYDEYIKNRYDVIAVFDDRNRVVDMWREEGLPTYQVWYGDF